MELQNILLPGHESEESLDILISLTNMRSEEMAHALRRHYVNGWSDSTACSVAGVSLSNFNRDCKKLNDVARRIDKYFELNYKKGLA